MAKPIRRSNKIAQWRKFRKISQEDCAARAGMSASNLSQIENGVVNYTGDSLAKIAAALETTPGRLLEIDPFEVDELARLTEIDAGLSQAQREELAQIARIIILGRTTRS